MDNTFEVESEAGGLYVLRLSDVHYYGGRAVRFRTRWRDHLRSLEAGTHDNKRMQAVYNKYGQFTPTVFSRIEDQALMFAAEQQWLDENFRKLGCLNLSPHADGGCESHTEETRKKMSQTRLSRPDLIEQAKESAKKNFSVNQVKGAKKSEESVRKSADGHRGKKQSSQHIAKRVAAHLGRKNTPETILLMSESAKRRSIEKPTVHSEGTKSLISTQQKGRVWVNDGTTNTRIWPDQLPEYEVRGFLRGRVGFSPVKKTAER